MQFDWLALYTNETVKTTSYLVVGNTEFLEN